MATPKNNSKEVGLEEQLWKAADKLRKNIDDTHITSHPPIENWLTFR